MSHGVAKPVLSGLARKLLREVELQLEDWAFDVQLCVAQEHFMIFHDALTFNPCDLQQAVRLSEHLFARSAC